MASQTEQPYLPVPAGELGLLTDFYELTMAQSYFAEGMDGEATFSLYVREYPPDRGYMVAAGIDDASTAWARCRSMMQRGLSARQPECSPRSPGYLRGFRFSGSVRAYRGQLVFTTKPVLEVTAPVIAAQLPRPSSSTSAVQSLLATKSARCVDAAEGARWQTSRPPHPRLGGVLRMARASYIAGFLARPATSCRSAIRHPAHRHPWPIPTSPVSTMRPDAFRAYARRFPDRSILLWTPTNTINGGPHRGGCGERHGGRRPPVDRRAAGLRRLR